MSNWSNYYKRLENREPRQFFLEALSFFETSDQRTALDLGSGDGTESCYLLQKGWQVTAIDKEAAAIRQLLGKLELSYKQNLQVKVSSFEKAKLPSVDFVYAGLSLPFCTSLSYSELLRNIQLALKEKGLFAGHFFGPNDYRASTESILTVQEEELRELLEPFELLVLRNLEEDAPSALGVTRHWHYFEVIAKKKV